MNHLQRIPSAFPTALLTGVLLLAACGGYTDPNAGSGGGTPPSGSFTMTGPGEIEVPRNGEATFEVEVRLDDGYENFVRLESGSWEAGLSVWHDELGFPASLRENPITGIAESRTITLTMRADEGADASADQNNFGTLIAQGTDDRDRARLLPSSQIKPRVVVR